MNLFHWMAGKSWLPINVVGPCTGLTLFKIGRWKLELWYAPADYSPPEHAHDLSDGEFTILYSKNRRIWRKVQLPDGTFRTDSYVATTPDVWGKFLTVRAGTIHKFETGDSCMVWLVFERWKKGCKVTSVATDFRLTNG